MRRELAIFLLLAVCLVPSSSAAPQARVAVGVYASNVPRFDRLTGQHTASALAFIGWDRGRTWSKPVQLLPRHARRAPHIALKTERGGGSMSTRAIALGQGDSHLIGLATAISDACATINTR